MNLSFWFDVFFSPAIVKRIAQDWRKETKDNENLNKVQLEKHFYRPYVATAWYFITIYYLSI